MRVLLISANTERINMPAPPLGAAMVAAATRSRGHEVELVDLLGAADPAAAARAALAAFAPDVVGISVRNIDDQDMAEPIFLLDRAAEVVRACRGATFAHTGSFDAVFPMCLYPTTVRRAKAAGKSS